MENKLESRIGILDRLSMKWGKSTGCVNFDDFLDFYDNEAVTRLVYIAMLEYEMQGINHSKRNNS